MAEAPWDYVEPAEPGQGRPVEATPEGRELGRNLCRFLDREIANRGGPVPERCAECALRPGTVANGSVETLMNLTKCLLEDGESGDFYCHMPGRTEQLCAGYAILLGAQRIEE